MVACTYKRALRQKIASVTKQSPKVNATSFNVSGKFNREKNSSGERNSSKGKSTSTTKVSVEGSCNSEKVHHYFPNKKKTVQTETSATKSQETKSGNPVTSRKRTRISKNTKCPICTRQMQAKNYDEHLKLHSDDSLNYECMEASCGAQYQYFHRMKAHFINKHKKFIVQDGHGGYKVKAERGKKTAKSPPPSTCRIICAFKTGKTQYRTCCHGYGIASMSSA